MRVALGLLIGVLSGVLLAILTIPLGPYVIFPHHGPKDEFTGIAMFGAVIMTSGTAAIVAFVGAAVTTIVMYNDERDAQFKKILKVLSISVAVCVAAIAIFAAFNR